MSTPPVREQFLVISALGANSMELTNVLCRASHENRCSVISTRLSRHGEYSALVLQISGSWDALARLEGTLPGLAKKHAFIITQTRSAAQEVRPQALPYVAYVSSVYRPDILNELCQFFSDHKVELENLRGEGGGSGDKATDQASNQVSSVRIYVNDELIGDGRAEFGHDPTDV